MRGEEHETGVEKGEGVDPEIGGGEAGAGTEEARGGAGAETDTGGAGAGTVERIVEAPEVEEMIEGEIEVETGGWRQDSDLRRGGEVQEVVEEEGEQEVQSLQSEGWGMYTASSTFVTSDPHPLICLSPRRREMPGPSSACSSVRGAGPGMWRTSSLAWGKSGM